MSNPNISEVWRYVLETTILGFELRSEYFQQINFNCTFLDLGGLTIGFNVLIVPQILSDGHPLKPEDWHTLVLGISHQKECVDWSNVTILPGVAVGENSIVAARAVVSKDVPANLILGGIPVKMNKKLD